MTLPRPGLRNACTLTMLLWLGVVFLCTGIGTSPAHAESADPEPWYEGMDIDWGGHLRLRGSASWPDDDSFFGPVGTGTYYDGST